MKLTAEQFEQIVAHLRSDKGRGGQQDRRRAPRVGLRTLITIVPCVSGGSMARREVRVRDLSADGIGLLHREPLKLGTFLVSLLPRANGEPVNAVYRVVRCHQVGDRQYLVGAKLDRVIDNAALQAGAA